jgi:hypothetical protein
MRVQIGAVRGPLHIRSRDPAVDLALGGRRSEGAVRFEPGFPTFHRPALQSRRSVEVANPR